MPETIVAIATGPAEGGVGILRISGEAALGLGRRFCPELPEALEPRRAYFTAIRDPEGAVLDEGLFLYFEAPASFTGEDVVELQTHGSPRLLRLLLELSASSGLARLAQPGEFTERAFLSGRIDLSAAEAAADLISARSEAAVRSAAASMRGELGARVRAVRGGLVELAADVSASLDFPDETEGASLNLGARLVELGAALEGLVRGARSGRLVRRGAKVVLAGAVNAGKSSLFNRLLDEERALVDGVPGTTRDFLEARWELDGFEVLLVDTAGVRADAVGVEAEGILRGTRAMASADAVIWVGSRDSGAVEPAVLPELLAAPLPEGIPVLRVRNKVDVAPLPGEGVSVSARTGEGVEAVRAWIRGLFGAGALSERWSVSERQAEAIRRASEDVTRAGDAFGAGLLEVVAAALSEAVASLGEITGEGATEAVVGKIFERFCIGK